jgi:hypothetical protein
MVGVGIGLELACLEKEMYICLGLGVAMVVGEKKIVWILMVLSGGWILES